MKKGLQSLDFSFEADTLTHYGGLFLIQRFCNKLDLRRRLKRTLVAAPDWSDFDPVDLILMLLFLLSRCPAHQQIQQASIRWVFPFPVGTGYSAR